MQISEISIKRPVLATVMNLVILLIGLIAYDRLSVRLIPDVDVPIVTVFTFYPGANAQVIETQITQPIDHVAEKLNVTALVGTDGNCVGVFLDGCQHDVEDTPVVAQVDHLDPLGLDQATHDVDRGVVAVEQRCRGDEPQRRGGFRLCPWHPVGGVAHVFFYSRCSRIILPFRATF